MGTGLYGNRQTAIGKLSVIIYDCDGVLIDSRRSNEAFYNHILSHFNLPPLTPEQLDIVHASTAQEAVDFLFRGTPYLSAAQDFQRQIDNAPFLALIRPEPHIREVLAHLRPAYHTAIATNRGKSLPLVLQTLGLQELFDLTVSCYDVAHPKPHPECLQKILHHFQVGPDEALYIGDSGVDRLVAEKAGVPLAAYKNPGLTARYHLQDHRDLLQLLDISRADKA
ncbi:MAG: HAD family hydrolase [Deltaproteobacteria bacterium]|nr:HAD family hydrolase [Deltaproteobacteria bacterium]